MSFANLPFPHFGRLTRGRVALALSHAIIDSNIRPQVESCGSQKPSTTEDPEPSYFTELLKQPGCRDAWNEYTSKSGAFPKQLADGSLPLNGFRHYMLQDVIYLDYYVRVRMAAIGTWDSAVSINDLKAFVQTIQDGLQYSEGVRLDCENKLGIPKQVADNEKRSDELQTSVRYYEKVIAQATQINKDNAWIDIYFALLPCIRGYYTIATALLGAQDTLANTPYYSLWIQPNTDKTYVDQYDKFLGDNTKSATAADWKRWGEYFKQACTHELNFFNLALKTYPPYDIVAGGMYTIHPFPYATEEKSLAVDSNNGVMIANGFKQWRLLNSSSTNTEDGYFIKLPDNRFLCYNGTNITIASDPSKSNATWSINPVSIPGYNTYQLFPGTKVQLALGADGNKVTLAPTEYGVKAQSQSWILNLIHT